MRKTFNFTLGALALLAPFVSSTLAQDKGKAKAPPQPMSFFVTSVGGGKGANYGGLKGADLHCQTLAQAVGAGDRNWVAYLSTQGPGAVNARDRIGKGPWYNAKGAAIATSIEHLHGDTVEVARTGNSVTKNNALNEKGEIGKGVGDTPNTHDIITGSQPDGRAYTDAADHTCSNYTSEAADGIVQLGHFDRNGGGISWNSVHASRGCGQANLVATGGAGLLYCFATGPK